jgi:hypothetical protein
MNSKSHVVDIGQLHLAGLVLGALESGRVRMNARDYQQIASSSTNELAQLRTDELDVLIRRLPPALLALVENVLFERDSCNRDAQDTAPAEDRSWPAVLQRLRRLA